MAHHVRGRRRAPPPCAALHADDGVDPRHLARPCRSDGPDRSTQRLCGQVVRLLTLVLAGLTADENIDTLDVVAVEPAPDASRLRVRIASFDDDVDRGRVLARLEAARGRIRSELADHLVRRRIPDLAFAFDERRGPQ